MSKHRLRPNAEGPVTGACIAIGTALPWLFLIWKDASLIWFGVLLIVWFIVLVGLSMQQPKTEGRRVLR